MRFINIILLLLLTGLLANCHMESTPREYLRATQIDYVTSSDEDEDVVDIREKVFQSNNKKTIATQAPVVWLRIQIPEEIRQWENGSVLYTGSNEAAISMQAYLVTGDSVQDLGFCDARLDAPTCAIPALQYTFPVHAAKVFENTVLYLKIVPGHTGVQNDFYFMQPGYFSKTTVFLVFLLGLGMGFIGLTSLMSLVFYNALKEKSFLVYGILYMNLLATALVSRGIWDLLRPLTWITASSLMLHMQIMMLFFDLLFLQVFFQTYKRDRKFNIAINVLNGATVALAILAAIPSYNYLAWKIFPSLIIITQLFSCILLAYLYIQKRDWIVPVAIAWFISIIGIILWIAYRLGAIEGTWIYSSSVLIGRIIEGIILNAVLYDKLKGLVRQIFEGRAKMEEGRIIKTLLRTLSHDLSNTTQLISLSASVSLESNNPERIRKNLQDVIGAAQTQTDIINHAKKSYLLRGGRILSLERVNLIGCIENVKSLFQFKCEAKNIQLVVDYSPDEIFVVADSTSLTHQVLANLLSNAIKFTPEGKKIYISARIIDGDWAEVVVADEGIGMSKEIKDQIFSEKPISRPGTNQEESTGHGLLIVCDFIKAFGAEIDVESTEGKGTRMALRLRRNRE